MLTRDDWFTDEVHKELQSYVYRLIDPRTDETFYVGKGRGNRVFQHALEATFTIDEDHDILQPKLDLIREIHSAGLHVGCLIHRHGLNDDVAFEVESALIDAYPNLRNAVRGHHASTRGASTISELQYRYNLPTCELSPDHKIVLIKINKINGGREQDEIYQLVHYCWKLNKNRAERADYVLAVDRGVIIGAFVANEWLKATPENFSFSDGAEAHRWGFKGAPAAADIILQYVGTHGKRVTNINLTPQASVRYWQL